MANLISQTNKNTTWNSLLKYSIIDEEDLTALIRSNVSQEELDVAFTKKFHEKWQRAENMKKRELARQNFAKSFPTTKIRFATDGPTLQQANHNWKCVCPKSRLEGIGALCYANLLKYLPGGFEPYMIKTYGSNFTEEQVREEKKRDAQHLGWSIEMDKNLERLEILLNAQKFLTERIRESRPLPTVEHPNGEDVVTESGVRVLPDTAHTAIKAQLDEVATQIADNRAEFNFLTGRRTRPLSQAEKKRGVRKFEKVQLMDNSDIIEPLETAIDNLGKEISISVETKQAAFDGKPSQKMLEDARMRSEALTKSEPSSELVVGERHLRKRKTLIYTEVEEFDEPIEPQKKKPKRKQKF